MRRSGPELRSAKRRRGRMRHVSSLVCVAAGTLALSYGCLHDPPPKNFGAAGAAGRGGKGGAGTAGMGATSGGGEAGDSASGAGLSGAPAGGRGGDGGTAGLAEGTSGTTSVQAGAGGSDGSGGRDTGSGGRTTGATSGAGGKGGSAGDQGGGANASGSAGTSTAGSGGASGSGGSTGSAGLPGCESSTEADARLATLSSPEGALVPAFDPSTRFYTLSVPFATTEVSLAAVTCDPSATVQQLPDNPVAVEVGDTAVAVTVTARNTTTKRVYGVTITRREEEIWQPLADPTYFNRFVLDKVNPGRMYAGYDNGIYKSVDGGQNWTEVRLFTADVVRDMEIDPVNTDTLYIGVSAVGTGGTGIYRSTNRGNLWTQVVDDASVSSLAIDPENPSTVYAGTIGGTFAGDTRGILKSEDGGTTWGETNLGLLSKEIIDLQVDPLDPQILYASTFDRLHRSEDGGASWYVYDTGLPTGAVVSNIAIDPQNPSTLYVATQGDGVFKSSNGGAVWEASNTGISSLTTNYLLVSPVSSSHVYAATDDGVFRSRDGGASWSKLPDTGVFWTGDVGNLAISPLEPTVLYALFSYRSTGARIYKRTEP